MTSWQIVLALWIAFGGSHVALSSRALRPRLVAALGEGPFRGVYSGVALATFVPLVWFYLAHRHEGGLLWSAPAVGWTGHLLHAGNVVAFVLIAAGAMRPSAAAMIGGAGEPRGVHHLTRHAVFMGVALWGLLHAIPNGFASDVVFFGGFAVFALLGSWHQDRRLLAEREGYRAFAEATPFFPFAGRRTIEGLRGIGIAPVLVGLAVAGVTRALHAPLLG